MSQDIFPWKRVETFIGRSDYLNSLLELLKDGKFHLVAISGEYGYGKTRLLREFLEKAQDIADFAAPIHLIDLYQTETHSPQGLAQAIVTALGEKYAPYFQDYQFHKNERDQAQVAGSDASTVQKEEKTMLNACADGLKRLSADQPFLLLLDTAERWVYPTLPEFTFSEKAAPALEWLLKVRPTLAQGMVVLAGRPEIKDLDLPNAEWKDLAAFGDDDIQKYLQKTCELFALEFGLQDIKFTTDEIRALTTLSQGRPILLALFLERILHGDRAIREATAKETPAMFESELIKHLAGDENIGELLRYVGRAPKGVTLEMLSLMTRSKPEEILVGFEILKAMSFAKTFENNDRLFLHEEMYAMLARNIYNQPGDDVEADNAAQGLYKFYKATTSNLNKEIGQRYVAYAAQRVEDKATAEPLWEQIENKQRTLQILNAEFVFYRWRRSGQKKEGDKAKEDPIAMGLRRFYRIGHEAATSNEYQMLVWLRFELIRFIRYLQDKEERGYKQPWLPFLQGFMYVQEIWEINVTGKQGDVIKVIDERMLPGLEKIDGLSQEQKRVLSGMLKTWQGMAYLYNSAPEYRKAQDRFSEVIDD